MKTAPLLIGATALQIIPTALATNVPPELFSNLIPQKVAHTFSILTNPITYPHVTDTNTGKWILYAANWWTSGYFPATGYLLNTRKKLCGSTSSNMLGEEDWLSLARSISTPLLDLDADHGIGHDVGFISFPFFEELALNPQNQTAINAVNRFASMLAARFNPTVGCTRSWDTTDPTDFQVIMDNMMNLELLFHSAELTGNNTLRQIAISHADTTMKNHIRPDGSTWHVVEYNSTTGNVIKKRTAQGYSDSSTWARGQGWGVFGFANMYRLTKKTAYLETSRKLATWFLQHIPANGIVPWDFNAPPEGRPADTSAATLVVNGLLMLAQQETDSNLKEQWIDGALGILANVTKFAWRPRWESLLSNGTVNKPSGSFSTGIVYGDYYYIRAGNELITMGLASCPSFNNAAQSQKSSARRSRIPFRFW